MIFGSKKNYEENTIDVGFIQPTSESLDQILTESAYDSYQLRAGLYVSDVIMEEKVLYEGASEQILLEGLGKDIWNKLKDIFTKLKAKVLEWFNKIKRFFSLLFTTGKQFIEKFEEELKRKIVKGYKYKSYKYSYAALQSFRESKEKDLQKYYDKYSNAVTTEPDDDGNEWTVHNNSKVNNTEYQKGELASKGSSGEPSTSISDLKDEILKSLDAESINEYETALYKAGRNNETSEEDFEDFNGNSKDELMRAVSGKDKQLESISAAETKMNTLYTKVISKLESASGKFKGEQAGKISSYVSYATEVLRYVLSLYMIGNKVSTEITKEYAKSAELILKGYLRFKPAKAVTDNFNNPEGATSILESAMNLL